jgi:hypothetical protein
VKAGQTQTQSSAAMSPLILNLCDLNHPCFIADSFEFIATCCNRVEIVRRIEAMAKIHRLYFANEIVTTVME